ncbi:MAG: right-handed parallel beta-helix repeat-containing protein [Candidatus Pacebacteria bacterium]|nr:right-handed parallel beta-helix repeat-containing protein [Candidatus Paceibacterota bacterium]
MSKKIFHTSNFHSFIQLTFVFFLIFCGGGVIYASPLYIPGQTLTPNCLPSDPDCTVQLYGASDVAAAIAGKEDTINKSTSVIADGTSDTKYPSVKAVKDYADSLVSGLLNYRGAYDASSNIFPSTGGSADDGSVKKGDTWVLSVAGTLGGISEVVGNTIIANIDAPGQTTANWNTLNTNIGYVPEDSASKVTSISSSSTDTQYPSAKLLYDQLALKQDALTSGTNIKTINGNSILGSGDMTISGGSYGPGNLLNISGGGTGATSAQAALANLQGLPRLYVTNYGAKCDGQTLTDITTTSGSPVISSASYQFTGKDIGKLITIYAGTSVTKTAATYSNFVSGLPNGTGIFVGQQVVGSTIAPGTLVQDGFTAVYTGASSGVQLSKYLMSGSPSTSVTFVNPINTTIISVSGGNATLNTNMIYANSAGTAMATFGTDDTAAIQATDTAAVASTVSTTGGGVVTFPLGMCVISSSIIVDNNVSFVGLGAGKSIVKWISTSDMTNGAFVTNGGVYPKLVTLINNQWRDFTIDLTAATDATYSVSAKAILFQSSQESVVDHMEIINSPATCVATDGAMGSIVTNNMLYNCGRLAVNGAGGNGIGEGVSGSNKEGYVLSNNYIVNPAHYGIFLEAQSSSTLVGSATVTGNTIIEGSLSTSSDGTPTGGIGNSGSIGMTITGNTITGNGNSQAWYGINQDGGTLNSGAGVQSVIAGNYISATAGGVLVDYSGAAPSGTLKANLTISGNVINKTVGNGQLCSGCGIGIYGKTTGTAMSGVNINGNTISNNGGPGIAFENPASNVIIANNILTDNGLTTGTAYRQAGISIDSNISDIIIEGNRAYDDTGSNYQKYGLYINTSKTLTSATITGNDLTGNGTGSVDLLGTVTASSFQNNMGVDLGTLFTMSGCSATSATGGAKAGSYASGTTGTCTVALTFNGATGLSGTVPNGWSCTANDLTTPADVIHQSASTTSTATLSGTTVSGDVVNFSCQSY